MLKVLRIFYLQIWMLGKSNNSGKGSINGYFNEPDIRCLLCLRNYEKITLQG